MLERICDYNGASRGLEAVVSCSDLVYETPIAGHRWCDTAQDLWQVQHDALTAHAVFFKVCQLDIVNPHEVINSEHAEGPVVDGQC